MLTLMETASPAHIESHPPDSVTFRASAPRPAVRRCLCLGGSFNPPHYGHLVTTRAAAEKLRFVDASGAGAGDVLLIPSARPPHKPGDPAMASPADRRAMCGLAVASDPAYRSFRVDDLEMSRDGPSYTIDTVRALKARGHAEVWWLIGADLLAGLPSWRESAALLTEATMVVMRRPGHAIDWPALPPPVRALEANVVDVPAVPISATEVRRRIRAGEPIDGLTPPAVIDHIRRRGLYGSARRRLDV